MTRTLKAFVLAGMAMVALSALGASGAQAAEFHCSVEPCVFTAGPDETAGTKTAHHVLVFTNTVGHSLSITCNRITSHGTSSTKTATTVTLTGIAYDACIFAGQVTTLKMNGCNYAFTSHGAMSIQCPEGKKIEFEIPGCKIEIGSQALTGVTFHNIGTPGTTTTRVTVSTHVTNIAMTMSGSTAGCGGVDPTKTPVTGAYTTGNSILSAETEGAVPAEGWWA